MAEYKLPEINADGAAVVTTPLAADTDMASGTLTLLNEAGADAFVEKMSDITGWTKGVYAAGTAEIGALDLTGATLVANTMYSISLKLPYVIDFVGGGVETNAVYTTRTYTVPTDATPTATELADAFAVRINADLGAKFSCTAAAGVITVTADSVEAGGFIVEFSNLAGSTYTATTPWVQPIGIYNEVIQHVNADLVTGTTYTRFVIHYRNHIRHNAVKGLEVVKPSVFIYYLDTANGGTAAAIVLLESMLDGSFVTVADYLGATAL